LVTNIFMTGSLLVLLAATAIFCSDKAEYRLRSKEQTYNVKIKGSLIDQYGQPILDSMEVGLSKIFPLYNRSWSEYYEDNTVMARNGKFSYSAKGITKLIYEISIGEQTLRMSDTIAIDDPLIASGQKEVKIQLHKLRDKRCNVTTGSGLAKMRYAYNDTNELYYRQCDDYKFLRVKNNIIEFKQIQYLTLNGISSMDFDSGYVENKSNLLLQLSDTSFSKFPRNLIVVGTKLNPARFFPIPIDSVIKDFFSFDEAPPLDQPGWVDTLWVFPAGIEKSIKYFFAYFPRGDHYTKWPQFAKIIVKPVEYSTEDLWANFDFNIVINQDSCSRNLVTYPDNVDPIWAQR
jgi:hypothetical protein